MHRRPSQRFRTSANRCPTFDRQPLKRWQLYWRNRLRSSVRWTRRRFGWSRNLLTWSHQSFRICVTLHSSSHDCSAARKRLYVHCWRNRISTRMSRARIGLSPTLALSLMWSRKQLTPEFQNTSTNISYTSVFQYAYHPFHSTETAVVCIMNAMIGALARGHIGALGLLDLSVAFDTVDHNILAEILRKRFGRHVRALDWIVGFLSDCRQVVSVNSGNSGETTLRFGEPQRSIFGPKFLFSMLKSSQTCSRNTICCIVSMPMICRN